MGLAVGRTVVAGRRGQVGASAGADDEGSMVTDLDAGTLGRVPRSNEHGGEVVRMFVIVEGPAFACERAFYLADILHGHAANAWQIGPVRDGQATAPSARVWF